MAPNDVQTPMEGLDTQPPGDKMGFLDLLLLCAEHLRLLILVPVVAGLIGYGVAYLTPPTYLATAKILPPVQQSSSAAALASQLGSIANLLGGGAAGLKSPADQYVAFLKSNTIFDAIIHRFGLKELYGAKFIEGARARLAQTATISAGVKDGLISIEIEDRDPKRAADIANAFVDELHHLSKTIAVSEAAQRRLFFETQLEQAKSNLTKSEIALRSSGVSEATLKTVPQSAIEALARLKAQISAQEIRLSSMRMYMTDTNPQFRLALQELAALRAELSKMEEADPSKAAGNGAEYVVKYRDFKYHEALFEVMAKQLELARLDEAQEGAVIQVVDAAKPPERRFRPNRLLIALVAAVTALLATLVFFVGRRALQDASRDPLFAQKLERLRRLLSLRRS